MKCSFVRWAVRSVLAVAAVALAPTASKACTTPPPEPRIQIEQVGPNTFCIWICDYSAVGAAAGDFCVCAINKLGVIASVKSIDMFFKAMAGTMSDPCTPGGFLQPIFPTWNYEFNPNTGPSFALLAETGDWEGFLTQTQSPGFAGGPPGRPITIKIVVNLVSTRATLSDLVLALESGEPFIGTGKGNPDGTIMDTPMHPPAVLPAGPITILGGGVVPTVSEWGLIIMGLLFLSGGVVAMRVFASRSKAVQGA